MIYYQNYIIYNKLYATHTKNHTCDNNYTFDYKYNCLTMSLDYNICKRLKDAGFPQSNSIYRYFVLRDGTILDNHIAPSVIVNDILEQVIKPTLSELIEACGDEFLAILKLVHKRDNNWECRGRRTKTTEYHLFADTPSEAVALLWLALNEK